MREKSVFKGENGFKNFSKAFPGGIGPNKKYTLGLGCWGIKAAGLCDYLVTLLGSEMGCTGSKSQKIRVFGVWGKWWLGE